MNKKLSIKNLVYAGMIACIYIVVSFIFKPITSGPIQARISEALTVLPYFTTAAIPGLFIGCLITNIFAGAGIWDIVIGSLTTLLAAYLSSKCKGKKLLVPLPPTILNAIIIGAMLSKLFDVPLLFTMFTVGVGQVISCYIIGYPLMLLLEKYKGNMFD